MATQNFGLSYTVSSPALWNDSAEGKLGEAGTLFTVDLISIDKTGEAATLSVLELCDARSYLSGPRSSSLSGPSASTVSCG